MLESLLDKRIVLISGKGGVGRTSVAAAVAVAAARVGKRVLLTEIADMEQSASPLAQLFGRERLSTEPIQLAERLSACHLWAPKGHELFLRSILPGGALIAAALRSKALQTFLTAAPSFLEMGWFYHLLELLRAHTSEGQPTHELIVIDMPATGHTLALTGLPTVLNRLIQRGPIAKALVEGQAYMNDPQHAAAWVVTLPEILPVSEAIELVGGLRRTSVPLGCVVLNRVPTDPFTPDERDRLTALLDGKPVLGALDFHRVTRAREAAERLRSEVGLPLLELHEVIAEGEKLVGAMVDQLGGHSVGEAP